MTELPTWAIWLAVFLLPVIGYVVGLVQGWLTRKGAIEADNRGRREELMRQQRWASELSVSTDPRKAQLGVAQLAAILDSPLLGDDEKVFIDAALASAIHEPRAEIEAAEEGGEEVQVVQLDVEAVEGTHLPLEDDGEDDNGEEDVRGG